MKDICRRLRKFFYSKKCTEFVEWHDFDCGFKNISSQRIEKDKIRNIHKYYFPDAVDYKEKGTVPSIGYSYILLKLTASAGDSLQCGDKIAFCGNRIIYRRKWALKDYKYIYTVFEASYYDL